MKWCNKTYLDFIEDYRKCEVLWDVRNSNYKNYTRKRDVLLGLAQKYDLSEESIKKKIKNLRSAFHREHNRLNNKKRCSGSTNESKKWFAYESLQFILDVTEPRLGTASTINDTNIEFIDMRPPSSCSTSTSLDCIYEDKTDKKKKKRSNTVSQTENERRDEEVYNIWRNSNRRDEFSTYGEYVGNELRKISSKSQIYVKHIINNVLFKAALGVYDNTHGESMSSISDIDIKSNNLSP